MIDPTALAQLRTATRDCPAWSEGDPEQLNIKLNAQADPHTLNAFRALAWLTRETHTELLSRLVAEEIEYLAAHTTVFAPKVRPPRKAMRIDRPKGSPVLDGLADALIALDEEE